MTRKLHIGGPWLVGAVLLLAASGARSVVPWWNADFSNRVAVTVTNNDAAATPSPSSAEIVLPVTSRADRNDVRAVYYNGTTNAEIDSQVFRDNATPTPWIVENLSAGSTGYNSLPAGDLIVPTLVNGDDGGTTVTLPFSFPFGITSTNQVFLSIDGYLVPGAGQPTSLYGRNVATTPGIYPYTSDYTVGVAGAGMYYAADNNGPGGTARAIFRWEVADSGGATVIAKFAAILYANGDIRFVYSDLVTPPPTGIGGPTSYGELSYGVEFNNNSNGVITFPTDTYPTSATLSNHADILYTSTGTPRVSEFARVVVRLQQPIPAGGSDSTHYYVYFNNPSPQTDQKRDVKNVFDETLDFATETLGADASKWNVLEGGTMKVSTFQGKKIGLLSSPVSHPQAVVKTGALNKDYLNVELLTHCAPVGGGEREMAPMLRVPYDQAHADLLTDSVNGLHGGYGFAVYGFGEQYGFVSYINPIPPDTRGPAEMVPNGLTPDNGNNNEFNTILWRVTGDPGLCSAKYWKEGKAEPIGWMKTKNRADGTPMHGAIADPVYNLAGGTGMAAYSQQVGIDYMALRELRNVTSVTAAAETQTSVGPFIQGVLSSTKLGVLASAPVTITNGVNTYNLLTATDGSFKITLPAGTYTVSASAIYHLPASVAGVSPSASDQTNLVLVYVGATITGVCREFPLNKPSAGATVVLTDATTGDYVAETVADSTGNYSVMAPTGGSYFVTSIGTMGHGERKAVTIATAGSATVNLLGTLVGNGDCEAPDSTNSYPKLWSNIFDAPGAYVYTKAFNHTPGGHWSVGTTDGGNPSAWNAPPAAFYNWPVLGDTFDVTGSVWVYFTAPGQLARLRLRNNFPLDGIVALSGDTPDPNNEDQTPGNLDAGKVPVGRWYHIQITHFVGGAGVQLPADGPGWNMNLYTYGLGKAIQGKTATAGGTIYFDDFGFTLTPKASALAKVADSFGSPVAGAYVGVMDDGQGGVSSAAKDFLAGPYSYSDEAGNATIYTLTPGTINVGAWIPPSILSNAVVSDTGVIAGTASATASATPTTRATITLGKGTNVAKGITTITASVLGGADLNVVNLKNTVDDVLTTGWYSTDAPAFPYIITWNLGSVKTIDQIELWWERTEPDFDLFVGTTTDPTQEAGALVASITDASTKGIFETDFAPMLSGHVKVIKMSPAKSVQYIQVMAMGTGPSNIANQFLYEMRALSAAVTVPALTRVDAANALKIAAGLTLAAPADVLKLDVAKADGSVGSDGRITMTDVAAIVKHAP